jgi:hypothetical protein
VSTKDGPGWITFNTLAFRKGGPVSFFGRVAIFSQKPIDDDDVTASIHDLTPWTTDADKPTRVARRRHVDCAPDMMGLLLRTAASQRRSLRGLGDQGVSFV